jgi:flagellin-like hook-associated protein FlgL
MRISSQQIFDTGLNSLQQHTAEVVDAQRQISSGHKYNRASESALAAGLGVQVTFDNAQYDMYKVNQDHLNQVYATVDTQLKSIYDVTVSFQRMMTQAANDTQSADSRQNVLKVQAQKLRDTVDKILGALDASGQPIFKGSVGQVAAANNLTLDNGVKLADVTTFNATPAAGHTGDLLAAMDAVIAQLNGGGAPSGVQFDDVNSAINQVTRSQVRVGLLQNQLDAATQFAESQKLNVETARSNLLDTDLAQATSQLAKSNALLQAAQAIITKLDTNTLFQKL